MSAGSCASSAEGLRRLVLASESMGFRGTLSLGGIAMSIAQGNAQLHQLGGAVALVYKPGQILRFVPHAPPDVAGHHWLCAVVVPPDQRRQGIGRKLVRQILAEHDSLYLEAIGDERLQFFKSCGMVVSMFATHGTHRVLLLR